MLRPMSTPNSRRADHTTSRPKFARELPKEAEEFLRYLDRVRGHSPLTLRAYRSDFLQLTRYLARKGLPAEFTRLSTSILHRWATHLGEHYAPATVRRKLDSLSSLLTHLQHLGLIDGNPLAAIPKPKRTRKIPDPPSPEECRRLLAACQTSRERAILALLVFTGLRRSEVIGLDHSDLAEDLSELRVHCGKGGHQRIIPLHNAVRSALNEHINACACGDGPLIVSRARTRLGSTSLQRLFKRVLRRAGLQNRGLTIHSLRHAFASQLVKAGVDVATIAALMGHANISTTSLYLHSSTATKRAAISRLATAGPRSDPADSGASNGARTGGGEHHYE